MKEGTGKICGLRSCQDSNLHGETPMDFEKMTMFNLILSSYMPCSIFLNFETLYYNLAKSTLYFSEDFLMVQ